MKNASLTDTARALLNNGWSVQDTIDAVAQRAPSEAAARDAVIRAQRQS